MGYDIKPYILSPRNSLPKVECFAKLGKQLFSLLVPCSLYCLTVQRIVTRNSNFSFSRMIHVTSAKMSVLILNINWLHKIMKLFKIFKRVMQYIKLADNIYDL